MPAFLSAHTSLSIPALDAFQLQLTPFNSTQADLVHYCRITGGCEDVTKHGRCYKTGVGVLHAEHRAYLSKMGLEPETDANGHWYGFDPSKLNPLDDPEHVINQVIGTAWRVRALVPIRPRSRGERRSLRTLPVVTLHPRFPFNV